MVVPAAGRLDRVTQLLLGLGALWAVGLVVGAATLPAYDSSSGLRSTLLAENGAKVLVPVGLPLVFVLVVWAVLARRRRAGRAGAGALAWAVSVLALLGALVGILTIGIFVLPVAVLLFAVCGRAQGSAPTQASGHGP